MNKTSPLNTQEENELRQYVKSFPEFPKPGIIYDDWAPVFSSSIGVSLINKLLKKYAETLRGKVDCVVMLESRGFLIGPIIALHLNVPCIPVCKKGNLPNPVIELSYSLEYGKDTIVIQPDSVKKGDRLVVVDDFLATGGTLKAATTLLTKVGGVVVEYFVVMEKLFLEGRKKLEFPVICFISD
ncbi:uncharacterized protein LOC126845934 [Adelges cooleyi]|uniref:uncharacterized protein LOC126845934 n=1 Tax=Adelges cooleyi TaxID=133065 RepID=UPI00217F5A1B|nr:uncharacterized protein LOC126845934 [Adelges cooleyi]XP_050440933.1 uncharacterized protein LOC126845934 [Adelges cooleyi]XP_050440934.1 uncharacterized protein LOC126845934 [Adelges cooleyi]XP_050440935.1 uncharacterized protein LOC126845934 [Adelges cooleyi]